MELIRNTTNLRKYVKINASKNWDTYRPFVSDAQEQYITPYFGDALIEALLGKQDDPLRERICRALGPFSLALATDELSINFGETGHTVVRTETLAPASDAKIEKATNSLLQRAWHNLDRALRYLEHHKESYQEDMGDEPLRKVPTRLFQNYIEFQDLGLIDIGYSPLTFMSLRMLILRIETSETFLLLPDEYDYKANERVLRAMQAYTASRVAELQTNANRVGSLKDAPPIQLFHEGDADSKNYYGTQANYWRGVVIELLVRDGAVEDNREVKVNDYDRTVFFASGSRIED